MVPRLSMAAGFGSMPPTAIWALVAALLCALLVVGCVCGWRRARRKGWAVLGRAGIGGRSSHPALLCALSEAPATSSSVQLAVVEEADEAVEAERVALRDRIVRLRERNEQLEAAVRAGAVGPYSPSASPRVPPIAADVEAPSTLDLGHVYGGGLGLGGGGKTAEEVHAAMAPSVWITPSPLSATLLSWELDLYSCRGAGVGAQPDELLATALALFRTLDVQRSLGCAETALQTFLIAVCQGYLPQPFHNFAHGVYVLQGVVVMLQRSERLRQLLRPLDAAALCIAAVGHDIGHLGVNNSFLVNSDDPLALQYNDRSVLESMHIATLFRVLQKPGCRLFAALDKTEYRAVRKLIIDAIMATDLASHAAGIARFNARLELQPHRPLDSSAAADRQLVAELLLHASDLSGPVRPWAVSSVWAEKLQLEFHAQVVNEELLGLPPSTFLLVPKAQLEVSFMDAFVQPAWAAVARLVGADVDDRLADLANNRARWEQGGSSDGGSGANSLEVR